MMGARSQSRRGSLPSAPCSWQSGSLIEVLRTRNISMSRDFKVGELASVIVVSSALMSLSL